MTGTMTSLKSAANVQELCMQPQWQMYCWRGANHCPVSKQRSEENNWNNDLFKVNSKCIRIVNEMTPMVYADDTGQISM